MSGNKKLHTIALRVSEEEADALEDALLAWNLCKRHNAEVWDFKKGRIKTEQEIFKMQDECPSCQRKWSRIRRRSLSVTGRIFAALYKDDLTKPLKRSHK